MLQIQYAGRLHLERFIKTPFPPILKPTAPILLLTGNIGRPDQWIYRDFLHYCSRSWKHVLVVAGPCELYSTMLTQVPAERRLAQCEDVIAEFQNVHFLNRERITCEGVTFLGASLWPKRCPDIVYRYIFKDGWLITEEDTQAWHERDNAWLQAEMASLKKPAVILTHFCPDLEGHTTVFADLDSGSGEITVPVDATCTAATAPESRMS